MLRDGFRNDRARPNDGALPYRHPAAYCHVGSDPTIVFDDDGLAIFFIGVIPVVLPLDVSFLITKRMKGCQDTDAGPDKDVFANMDGTCI